VRVGVDELISRPGLVPFSPALDVTRFLKNGSGTTLEIVVPAREVVRAIVAAESQAGTACASATYAASLLRSRLRNGSVDHNLHTVQELRLSYFADELVRPFGVDPYVFLRAVLMGRTPPVTNDGASLSSMVPEAEFERRDVRHQALLARLLLECEARGLATEVGADFDARVRIGACQLLFEVKTAEADTFVAQTRLGIGQLIDYWHRHRHDAPSTALCLVITDDRGRRDWLRRLLTSVNIMTVIGDSLIGLDDALVHPTAFRAAV
jgi:hypothetical protein